MKKIYLIIFMTLAQCYVFGQGKIEFSEFTKDLGEINSVENDFEVSYKFKNVGNEPIKIQEVILPLNTMRAFYPKTDIQPGGEGVITVRGFMNKSGLFKRSATVRSTGLVELTRLYFSGTNLNPDGKIRSIEEEFPKGGSFLGWIKQNLKTDQVGIDKNIIYNVKLRVQIDNRGKITKAEYNKTNLPASICKEIDRLTTSSPDFNYFYWDRQVSYILKINDYHYTNPADEAYWAVTKLPDIGKIVQSVNGEALEARYDIDVDGINKKNYVPIFFIVEKNGDITNVMGALSDNYCTSENIKRVNEIIGKIKLSGKVIPAEKDNMPCRFLCLIAANLNK